MYIKSKGRRNERREGGKERGERWKGGKEGRKMTSEITMTENPSQGGVSGETFTKG